MPWWGLGRGGKAVEEALPAGDKEHEEEHLATELHS